jgi:hypothetical protein
VGAISMVHAYEAHGAKMASAMAKMFAARRISRSP